MWPGAGGGWRPRRIDDPVERLYCEFDVRPAVRRPPLVRSARRAKQRVTHRGVSDVYRSTGLLHPRRGIIHGTFFTWQESGCSSVGRAPASQAGCRGFKSRRPLSHRALGRSLIDSGGLDRVAGRPACVLPRGDPHGNASSNVFSACDARATARPISDSRGQASWPESRGRLACGNREDPAGRRPTPTSSGAPTAGTWPPTLLPRHAARSDALALKKSEAGALRKAMHWPWKKRSSAAARSDALALHKAVQQSLYDFITFPLCDAPAPKKPMQQAAEELLAIADAFDRCIGVEKSRAANRRLAVAIWGKTASESVENCYVALLSACRNCLLRKALVPPAGVEPATLALGKPCSVL